MKDFLDAMTPRLDRIAIRHHLFPFLCCVMLVMLFYLAGIMIGAGWTSWAVSTVIVTLLVFTAWARLNDIPREKYGLQWQTRRIGLVLVVGGGFAVISAPWTFSVGAASPDFPTWREVMFRLGILFTWMTTPFMPPWHRYMSGEHRRMEVEVPDDVMVDVVRTPTDVSGDMYVGKPKK
jgi:hypothetical protein